MLKEVKDNWKVPQPVNFSLEELNMLQKAVIGECNRYYEIYGRYDVFMRALMFKIDEIILDIEVKMRDKVE